MGRESSGALPLGAGGLSPPPAEICALRGMLIKKAKSIIRICFKAWGYLFGEAKIE